jgi:hypothetical protein
MYRKISRVKKERVRCTVPGFMKLISDITFCSTLSLVTYINFEDWHVGTGVREERSRTQHALHSPSWAELYLVHHHWRERRQGGFGREGEEQSWSEIKRRGSASSRINIDIDIKIEIEIEA